MSDTLPPHVDLLDRLVANVRLAEAAHVQGWDAEAARYEQEVRGLYYQVLGYMQVPDPSPSSRVGLGSDDKEPAAATDGAVEDNPWAGWAVATADKLNEARYKATLERIGWAETAPASS